MKFKLLAKFCRRLVLTQGRPRDSDAVFEYLQPPTPAAGSETPTAHAGLQKGHAEKLDLFVLPVYKQAGLDNYAALLKTLGLEAINTYIHMYLYHYSIIFFKFDLAQKLIFLSPSNAI